MRILITVVLALLSLLGTFLKLADYQGTTREKTAIWIWIVLVLIVACYCFYYYLSKPLSAWLVRIFRIICIAKRIERAIPNRESLDRLENWIKRHVIVRGATESEVDNIVREAPDLKVENTVEKVQLLKDIRREIYHAKLLWFRWHEAASQPFQFYFDFFRFLNPDSSMEGVGLLKHQIIHDIIGRFKVHFDTIVYLDRGNANYSIATFFDKDLREVLHFTDFIGYPVSIARRPRFSYESDLLKACHGKSILLIDPILVDRGLDEALEKIQECQGTVNGVAVIFEVTGVNPKQLSHYTELQQKSGQPELRGQIILNLKHLLTEPS